MFTNQRNLKKRTDSAGLRTFSLKIGGFPFSPKGLSHTTHHILFPLTIYFMNCLPMKPMGVCPSLVALSTIYYSQEIDFHK